MIDYLCMNRSTGFIIEIGFIGSEGKLQNWLDDAAYNLEVLGAV